MPATMTQIRSGQPFLYRRRGYHSTVVEVRMRDSVRGGPLNVALTALAPRFPYLTGKLVERDGAYFLARNDNSLVAVKTDRLRTLGSMETGYHLVDVTFTRHLIRVAFHHGLCDGGGILPFVESLVWAYCCERYRRDCSSEGIRVPGERVDPAEFVEPFGRDPMPAAMRPMDAGCEKDLPPRPLALPESTGSPVGCWRTELVLDEGAFVASARSVGATPATFAALLLSRAVLDLNPGADLPVVCNLAMDLRRALGVERTCRNCVGTAALPFSKADLSAPLPELASRYRATVAKSREPDAALAFANRQVAFFDRLDEVRTLEGRRQLMAVFDGMVNDTYVISYLGRLRLNDYADLVEGACFYSDGICGLTVNMLAAAGSITMEVLQGFEGDRYARAFIEELRPHGLASAGGTVPVETGGDRSGVTASRQAERLFARAE